MSSSATFQLSTLSLDDKRALLHGIARCLEQCQAEKQRIVDSLGEMLASTGFFQGYEVVYMLKNKFGFTKDDAKKIYYKYRQKDNPDPPESQPPPPKNETGGDTDQKIAAIMDYMQDTSKKLEKIENDIDYLKKQVDRILKQI